MIHLAAKVGGLYANMKDKVGFYEDNMLINMNVLKACHKEGVKKIVSAFNCAANDAFTAIFKFKNVS